MTIAQLQPASMATPGGPPMLFSLEVEDSGLAGSSTQHGPAVQAQLQLLQQALEPLLQPVGRFHAKLVRDVALFRDILLAEDDEVDGVVLASKLTAAGYRVAVRQAIGGGSGVAVFSNLRHSFLLVTAHAGSYAGVDFIVEPHFREQFEISHPTPRYSGLLAMLPSVVVAPAAQLTPLVQLLCAEMGLAFEQHGLSLPPWRQSKSLLSKWLPSKARDFDLSPSGSPRAASPPAPFPLASIAAHAAEALGPISEAASGSITPGGFSGDDASPRAVLRSASARLLTHQAVQEGGGSNGSGGGSAAMAPAAPAAPPNLVRKSLLTSSLAPGRRGASPEPLRRADSARGGSPAQPGSPAGGAGVAAASAAVQLQPQLVQPTVVHHGGTAGMSYRVASEWLQPAIRTVKMQGPQPLK